MHKAACGSAGCWACAHATNAALLTALFKAYRQHTSPKADPTDKVSRLQWIHLVYLIGIYAAWTRLRPSAIHRTPMRASVTSLPSRQAIQVQQAPLQAPSEAALGPGMPSTSQLYEPPLRPQLGSAAGSQQGPSLGCPPVHSPAQFSPPVPAPQVCLLVQHSSCCAASQRPVQMPSLYVPCDLSYGVGTRPQMLHGCPEPALDTKEC